MNRVLTDYIQYNEWANKQLIDFLRQHEALLEKGVNNSFPSLLSTLLHIWDAQSIWLNRLQGKAMTYFPSTKFEGTALEALQSLEQQSAAFVAFVQEIKPDNFEKNCTYKTTTNEEHSQLVQEIMLHVMNHSTYHRGQLITICYQLGIKGMPSTDYIFYLRQKNKAN